MRRENQNTLRQTLLGGLTVCLGLAGSACGPNPNDAYLEAMRAQGTAERGTCRLQFDANRRSHTVNSGQITRCIRDMNEVMALYEKAQKAGYEGKDLDRAMLKVNEDLRKLRAMQGVVSEMEAVK